MKSIKDKYDIINEILNQPVFQEMKTKLQMLEEKINKIETICDTYKVCVDELTTNQLSCICDIDEVKQALGFNSG